MSAVTMDKNGNLSTPCCLTCGDDEDDFQPVRPDNEAIQMGRLYRLSRFPKSSRTRRALEARRQTNGTLVCGACYFNATDDL